MAALAGLTMLVVISLDSSGGTDEHVFSTKPAPVVSGAYSVWDRLAQCESTGNWQANTGNGYYGGTQTDIPTWRRYGGTEFASRPDIASREQQIAINQRILASQGWKAWPVCSRRLGLR